jgi:hypothetical protein
MLRAKKSEKILFMQLVFEDGFTTLPRHFGVTVQQSTRHNNPEDSNLDLHPCHDVKPRNALLEI